MKQTLEQLKDLKLNGFLEAWQQQQAQPLYQDLPFDERLALLVECEYLRRHNQRQQRRRLKQAKLFIAAPLAEVDFEVPRSLKKVQFLQWAQGQWLAQHLNLIHPTPKTAADLHCFLHSIFMLRFQPFSRPIFRFIFRLRGPPKIILPKLGVINCRSLVLLPAEVVKICTVCKCNDRTVSVVPEMVAI